MNSTATTQDTRSEIVTTQKIAPVNSPVEDCANPTGTKPAAVIKVPVNIGKAVLVQAKLAALKRFQPSSIFTCIISTAMMASSTSKPSAIISAPREMRCRLIPMRHMMKKVMLSTSGTDNATTTPVRRPNANRLTPKTMPSANTKWLKNSFTERSTKVG